MEVIDCAKKGNVVRFYLGEKDKDWGYTNQYYKDEKGNTPDWLKPCDTYYGDDWDDYPMEHNAGIVYDEFIKGYIDLAFAYDAYVLEPSDCYSNWPHNDSGYCRNDLKERKVPCIIIVPEALAKKDDCYHSHSEDFYYWLGNDKVIKIYFGDNRDSIMIGNTICYNSILEIKEYPH